MLVIARRDPDAVLATTDRELERFRKLQAELENEVDDDATPVESDSDEQVAGNDDVNDNNDAASKGGQSVAAAETEGKDAAQASASANNGQQAHLPADRPSATQVFDTWFKTLRNDIVQIEHDTPIPLELDINYFRHQLLFDALEYLSNLQIDIAAERVSENK